MLTGDMFTRIQSLLSDEDVMTSMLKFVKGVADEAEAMKQDARVETD